MLQSLNSHIDTLLDRLTPSRRGGMTNYLAASGMVLLALIIRLAIAPAESGLPFLTFFPIVTLVAICCGIGPGIFSMIVCSILASYMFFPPFLAFPLVFGPEIFWSNIMFCVQEMIVIAAVESMYRQRSNYVTTVNLLEQIKKAEQELRISATAFEVEDGIMITDATGTILRVNQAMTKITGYSPQELIGQTPRLLKSGRHDAAFYAVIWESIFRTGSWKGEIWDRRKSGEIYPKWLSITAVRDETGAVTNFVSTHSDITERKATEDEIKSLAFFDPLTQLPNRRLLQDRLQQALTLGTRNNLHGALLFIDLDSFKSLNDNKGHDAGDRLLQQAAKRIALCVRECDTVARLGGDEFVVLLTELEQDLQSAAAQAKNVGKKILNVLNQPYNLQEYKHYCSASIGITLFDKHSLDTEDLLKQVDIAMYQAKAAGRNCLRFFDPEMQASISKRFDLEKDLRIALLEGQLKLYYQIQVDRDCRGIGAEVLLRWQHPDRGLILPMDFIPLAEETGLILPIGQWVLESACAQLGSWEQNPGMRNFQLAVNVSAYQFHQANFVDMVLQALQDKKVDPSRLKLELTESTVLNNIGDAINKMHALKERGVQFSMDDFGTGYSSLAYLTQLPFAQLKIDQSFVRNINLSPANATMIQTIIGMAKNLGLEVIAEGVETEEQRAFLERFGCFVCQGYLFGRPVLLAEFEEKLENSMEFPPGD